eukprot:CAMPEP_0171804314 /NCGR_PEP_ID=MMETSP0991-20121206/74012_1 /TAXON_ID=483369 /ORGANISM="non described non described, Strain CCMP2098" /LENGTH=312 /DNA_ID=CAMNT_0012416613 /DNA_START=31 /DNA_END=965 /DNA_ORIENTATION=+
MDEFGAEPLEAGLAFRDLDTPNALADLIHSLNHLDALVNTVFENIEAKVGEEASKLDDVNARLSKAQNGIVGISGGRGKATTVFSTAKFPAPKILPDFSRLHVGDYSASLGVKPYAEAEEEKQYNVADMQMSPLTSGSQVQSLLDMFKIVNAFGTDNLDPAFTMEKEGLGRVPRAAGSTGELLLFNSSMNPYKAYSSAFDNLAEAHGHKDKEEEADEELAAQPESVASGILLPDVNDFQYSYVPGSTEGQVQLDLPTNIELPGIASDMAYDFAGGAAMGSMAPSAFKNDNLMLPDLPQIEYKPAAAGEAPAP